MGSFCLGCIEILWKKRPETQYVSMSDIVIVEQPLQPRNNRDIIREANTDLMTLDGAEDDLDPDILPTPPTSPTTAPTVKIDRTPTLKQFVARLEAALVDIQKLTKRYRRAAETLQQRTSAGAFEADELTVDECPDDDIEEVDLADRTCQIAEWLAELSKKIDAEIQNVQKKITMDECIDITEREMERVETFIVSISLNNVQEIIADYTSSAVPLPPL